MLKQHFFSNVWQLLKKAVLEFIDGNDLKYSASLSYYTIFSLPPLLIIVIALCSIFFGPDAVRGEIYGQIAYLVGKNAAVQIQEMIKNAAVFGNSTIATIIGAVTLLIGATGVFGEIQDSINRIWGLKAKTDKGFMLLVRNRIISFSMIISIGFLMLVALVINALMDALSKTLQEYFASISVYLLYMINIIILFGLTTLLFSIVFKTLPDGVVSWKDTLIGSTFTAFLFMLGKSAIGLYLGNSNIATTYGAAGSLIIILLWVYYSSVILYFGAEFTKVYSYTYGEKITPNSYAVYITNREIEKKELKKTEEPNADVVK